ncbi:MAG: FliM/FliN family flagellar motor switch protein [Terriglobia bacterium]
MSTVENNPVPATVHEYLDLWTRRLTEGLSRTTGLSVKAERVSGEESLARVKAEFESGAWVRLFAGKAGEQAFSLDAGDALRLLKLLRGPSSGEAATLDPAARQAVNQFFLQIATTIPVSSWVGFDCELELAGSEPPVWESAAQAMFRLSTPESPLLILHARLSADFVAALQSGKEKEKLREQSSAALPPPVQELPVDLHLELLKDVELEVTLRFGQREMFLKDVLNLTPGSVIELDQQIHDPVELLAGSKVIAWGEVVAVDGNYGLRITKLPSREERLKSLRK